MVEVIDKNTFNKMMMMVLCGIKYQDYYYLVYCIRRDKKDANVFVSKMFKGSQGYIINSNFENGEKESIDVVIKRILNKEKLEILNNEGFYILKKVDLDSNLEFDMNKCYVGAIPTSVIKNCLMFYDLVNKKILEQPVVEVADDKRKFNEGFTSSIVLIVFGIFILLFTGVVLYNVLFG